MILPYKPSLEREFKNLIERAPKVKEWLTIDSVFRTDCVYEGVVNYKFNPYLFHLGDYKFERIKS